MSLIPGHYREDNQPEKVKIHKLHLGEHLDYTACMEKQIIIPVGFNKELIEKIGWSPAIKVGNEVLISALGGITHPQQHIFSVGETIEDQTRIILDHLEDILDQAGGTIEDIVDFTVFVRPFVTDEDKKKASKIISQAFTSPAPTETWLVCDFAGSRDELLQLKARAILS